VSIVGAGAPAANQSTRARSLTIRRLLVRASSRSIAKATSSGRGSVDQRLPTRRTSPRRSSSCSRAIVLSLVRPAARAAIALENEPGILRSAARRRSGRRSVRGSPGRGFGSEIGFGAAGAGSGAGSGLRPTGGSSPKRARQPPHKTTGPRSAERTISNRRHARPEWQTAQRRPARSNSVRSSALISLYVPYRRSARTPTERDRRRAIRGVDTLPRRQGVHALTSDLSPSGSSESLPGASCKVNSWRSVRDLRLSRAVKEPRKLHASTRNAPAHRYAPAAA